MDPAPAFASAHVPFADGFGIRHHRPSPNGLEEILEVRPELAAVPSFEFAVRERVGRFSNFLHPSIAGARRVERTPGRANALGIVSDCIEGYRLTTLLSAAERREVRIDPAWAIAIGRQLLDAIAAFHEIDRDAVHAAIGPERVVITGGQRPVVTDVALGSAIEQLHYTQARYWNDLRIAAPASGRFDQRHDLRQVAYVMVALLIGRHLRPAEGTGQPAAVDQMLASILTTSERSAIATEGYRWLRRALGLDEPFASLPDAARRLTSVLEMSGAAHGLPTPLYPPETSRAPQIDREPEPVEPPRHTESPAVAADRTWPAAVAQAEVRSDWKTDPVDEPVVPPDRDAMPRRDHASSVPSNRTVSIARALLPGRRWLQYSAAAALVALVAFGGWRLSRRGAIPAQIPTGTLTVSTPRAGVMVFVDGVERGVTPLTAAVIPGRHVLELRDGATSRTLPITIAAGSTVSQYVELSDAPSESGGLRVRTQPDGALVSIDGVAAGRSPVTVQSIAPGEHVVVVTGDFPPIKQVVVVERGVVASLLVSRDMTPAAERTGSLIVRSPIDLQLFEREHLIGTTMGGRVSLPPGMHEIDFLNTGLEFGVHRKVQVTAGKETLLTIDVPKGMVAVNANPWAAVWLDGQSLGDTPLGNVATPIGTHELVFRHPSFGEQRRTIAVSARSIARVSVNFMTR